MTTAVKNGRTHAAAFYSRVNKAPGGIICGDYIFSKKIVSQLTNEEKIMNVTGLKYLFIFVLSVMAGFQAAAVKAGDLDEEIKQAYRQELIQEIKNNFESRHQLQQRNNEQPEQKDTKAGVKPVSYLSILGLIINDAMGYAEKDLQVRLSPSP